MTEPEFDYDVFISYSHKDADWVRNWPLPVQQTWQETPDPLPDWVPGGYAKTPHPAQVRRDFFIG